MEEQEKYNTAHETANTTFKPFKYWVEDEECTVFLPEKKVHVIDRERFIKAWEEIQSEVHQIAVSKGWWDTDRSDGEIIALIHSELSEALEACRKEYPSDKHLPHRGNLEVELADAVIRIMDWAGEMGLDLCGSLLDKVEFNRSRPHKHGKIF